MLRKPQLRPDGALASESIQKYEQGFAIDVVIKPDATEVEEDEAKIATFKQLEVSQPTLFGEVRKLRNFGDKHFELEGGRRVIRYYFSNDSAAEIPMQDS